MLPLRALPQRLVALLLLTTALAHGMNPHHLYIGTYTRDGSKGIYALTLDTNTGELSAPEVAAETKDPSFLALSPDQRFLYAVSESAQMAAAFAVAPTTGSLSPLQHPQPAGGAAPCHLAVDATGRSLLVANYRTGLVAALPIRADGTLGEPGSVIQHTGSSVNPTRQSSPHVHSVTISPDNRHVIVCDLGLDKIFAYRLDPATALLTPAEPPFVATAPGSGPRHFKFSPDGRHAFAIAEMGSTLTAYAYSAGNGALTPLDTRSTLPENFTAPSSCAEVRVHPNGRFIYGSNRGHDSIAVFAFAADTGRLTPVEIMPTGGKSPRNFALSPDGAWLVAANQNSNSLTVFRVDATTGRLTRVAASAQIFTPVCVLFRD